MRKVTAQRSGLIPGQSLIYERVDGVVYARYRDPPHNTVPRWIVGGDPDALDNLKKQDLLSEKLGIDILDQVFKEKGNI